MKAQDGGAGFHNQEFPELVDMCPAIVSMDDYRIRFSIREPTKLNQIFLSNRSFYVADYRSINLYDQCKITVQLEFESETELCSCLLSTKMLIDSQNAGPKPVTHLLMRETPINIKIRDTLVIIVLFSSFCFDSFFFPQDQKFLIDYYIVD